MNDRVRLDLYEDRLKTDGQLVLSQDNADWFLAQRSLTIRSDPERPKLVVIERPKPGHNLRRA